MKIIGSDKGIHSPEFHKKKTREKRIKQAVVALVVIIFVGVPIYLAHMQRFLISSIEVKGNDVTKSSDLQKIIADDLSGSYIWIFPRSNTAIYPHDKIVSDLLDKEPRLSSAVVERVGAKGLRVAVTERSAVAEYCKNISDPSTPLDCYFLDDTGYIFAPAPAFSGNVYLTYATEAPFDNPIGQSILDPAAVRASLGFERDLGSIGIYPRVFLAKGDEYHVLLSNGAEIMWNRSADFSQVVTNLASFLSDKSVKSDPTFLSRVAYIDMRFGNKIFYKFRGE